MKNITTILFLCLFIHSSQLKTKDSEKIESKKAEEPETCDNQIELGQFNNADCDLSTTGPICVFNGERILLPLAKPKGLIGYWNFDEIKPLDNSGNRNHGIGNLKPGPGISGMGSSALFSNGEYLQIPYNKNFQADEFTITFWAFFVQDNASNNKGIRFCPLLQRGDDDLSAGKYQRAPGVYLDRKERNINIYFNSEDKEEGEVLISNAKMSFQRWIHISVIKSKTLKLYINGILDKEVEIKKEAKEVNAPLYIGNAPWLKDQCDYPLLIDEFRYYNIEVKEEMIQAEASLALGGIDPKFLKLGCIDCSLKKAEESCGENYRLCSSVELNTAGYLIARSMGWINWNTHIWTYNALNAPAEFESLKGLGLCCNKLN